MKKALYAVMTAVILLTAASCGREQEYVVKGIFYTDSTMTAPMADQTLNFDLNYGRFTGTTKSDSEGKFAFACNTRGWGSGATQEKLSYVEDEMMVCCGKDTLCITSIYSGSFTEESPLKLYPKCHYRYGTYQDTSYHYRW